jgi:hypothetical protein
VVLNEELLRRKFAETQAVEGILAKAMSAYEDKLEDFGALPATVAPPAVDARFDGLDVRYHAALSELI